jgi:hypothetical protein
LLSGVGYSTRGHGELGSRRGIPFSYLIADGLALGFISYAVVKGFSGRAREIIT